MTYHSPRNFKNNDVNVDNNNNNNVNKSNENDNITDKNGLCEEILTKLNSVHKIMNKYKSIVNQIVIPSILLNPKTNSLIEGKGLKFQPIESLIVITHSLDNVSLQISVYVIINI